ncbi:low temperature requirement protein A [Micromonospora sp. WMMD961]|uniref:low temperature requirement protein A n=1 Tax=Micromonospora sp. WMMD961 TaxID=3016100 RepID=UPI002416704F|nr:low temperature requirement protein A [Micromonospora sp. WMMD961]MDG4782475.1 low temperature requirement protein A [Micromonospora sp. WMMD961]
MTDEQAAYRPLLRRREDSKQPAFLELFFDLVYVLTLTQLTHLLIDHLGWAGAFEAFVLLLALWWVWVLTAWMTDQFDPQHPVVQGYVILVMMAILVMAILVPRGLSGHSTAFAGFYVAINLGRCLFVLLGARGTLLPQRALRAGFWLAVSLIFWIASAFTEGWRRGVLWLMALAVDYLSAALRWPTPKLGRAPGWELAIAETHLAERYRQVIIVALGEIVLIMGITFANTDNAQFTFGRTVVLLLSLISTALMWRLYIYRAGQQLAPAIAVSPHPHRLSQWASYLHLVMIAGILLTAVGFTLIIEHPTTDPPPAWIAGIAGGPALFLAGRAGFEYLIFGRVTLPRLVGIVTLGGIGSLVVHLRPEITSAAATLVLAAVAALDAVRGHRRGREPARPPT